MKALSVFAACNPSPPIDLRQQSEHRVLLSIDTGATPVALIVYREGRKRIMRKPLQITFRNMDHSHAVEARVRELASRLERYSNDIMGCSVVVEANHHHHHKGNLYHVRIDLTVPGTELVVSRDPPQHQANEDVYVAVRDAFKSARRQLEDYARKQQGQVKQHEAPVHGRVRELMKATGWGMIETVDGRVIRFTRRSVVDGGFDKLKVGDEVTFSEAVGVEGTVASTVHPTGKHHPAE